MGADDKVVTLEFSRQMTPARIGVDPIELPWALAVLSRPALLAETLAALAI